MVQRFRSQGQWSKDRDVSFPSCDKNVINIIINKVVIKITPQIKVLGNIFYFKLQWTEHVANTIKKSSRNLRAIRIIAKYLKPEKFKTLITANFYSALYYNSEIWHLPNLKPFLKSLLLLLVSAKALKLCTPFYDQPMSYLNFHKIHNICDWWLQKFTFTSQFI